MLNQETIIKLAVQHGFKVGRDAGGEYVAPKYEDSVGSLVALVQAAYALGQEANTEPQAALLLDGCVPVPLDFLKGFQVLAHNYSLQAQAPDYYTMRERDAFCDAYARCGSELAKLRDKLVADLEKLKNMHDDTQKGGA